MAEELIISREADKSVRYKEIIPQIEALISDEDDLIANLANITAVLRETFNFFWVGFYLVKDGQLVLGPFQGPLACTRIDRDKGVCGKAWGEGQTIIVDDVDKFPGHIACSSESRSEIVVPLIKNNKVWGVLDVDSEHLENFDEIDKDGLEEIVSLIRS